VNGLQEPDSVKGATADYRDQSDPMGRFLASCTVPTKGKRSQSSKLYALFLAWAKAAGEREWSQTGFSKAMVDRGFRKIESHGMHWLDIEMVKVPADFDAPDRPEEEHSRSPWEDADDLP
jgi:putative DNA primase/helicase